jgi:hypothetical protein
MRERKENLGNNYIKVQREREREKEINRHRKIGVVQGK